MTIAANEELWEVLADGFVNAVSAKQCLEEASGGRLSNETLASIWLICDADGSGMLDKLEFMLAVHVVLHMVRHGGKDLPEVTPELLQPFNVAVAGVAFLGILAILSLRGTDTE